MAILRIKDSAGKEIEIPAIKGKSAYSYAKDGGYAGTEAEFANLLGDIDQLQASIADLKSSGIIVVQDGNTLTIDSGGEE